MSFNCSTTCVGIYADVQWVRKNFGEEMKRFLDLSEARLNKEFDNDWQSRFAVLEERMKLMENIMRGGKEMAKDKYKKLIVEYRKFKTKNVNHFRFSSAAVSSSFSKS